MVMRAWGLAIALTLCGSGVAHAHDAHDIAPTPKGGVSWEVLGATQALPWVDAQGINRLAPQFDAAVEALDGKIVRIAGYAMHEDGPQAQFTLYATAVDCAFHATPGPNLRAEVSLVETQHLSPELQVVEGRMTLVRARSGGVFFRLDAAQISNRVKND